MMAAEQIKAMVSMHDVLGRYGIDVGRGGFVSCPFHSEKTASCKIYDNSFYCFGCGAGGDVLDFVMKMENCSFRVAIDRLDLGHVSFSVARQYRKKQRDEAKKREEQAKKYWGLMYQWIYWDKLVMRYTPAGLESEPSREFLEALLNRENISNQIDCLEEW